jgi:hypothetical protein
MKGVATHTAAAPFSPGVACDLEFGLESTRPRVKE